MSNSRWVICVLAAVWICTGGLGASSAVAADPGSFRFGALPVLQALPLYVAQDKGLFAQEGVSVEIVPFNTAAEKDIALSAGQIEGCFADLVTPTVLRGNGRDIVIVATNYDTRKDRRMFAVLGKPGATYRSLADLAKVPVAVSSNSVIDHVTETLLKASGVPPDGYATVETKNIGLRMQMLLSGQVEAATLPEPLVTAALAKGALLLGDDAGLGTSQTVLVFSGRFLKERPDAARAFLRAVNHAAKLINEQPDAVRPAMVQHCRLPAPLQATYPVPRFPAVYAPDKDAVLTIAGWLKQRGVTRIDLGYEDLVNAGFVP